MKKIVFFLNENMTLTKTEETFIKNLNQVLLNYDNLKESMFKREDKILDFEFIRSYFDYSSDLECFQFELISGLNKSENGLLFDVDKRVIPVYNSPEFINMGIEDFCCFIKENNISTIFVEERLCEYSHLSLSEPLNASYYSEEEQIVDSILQKYIKCYNNILAKLNLKALTVRKYFCLFNSFAIGCVEKQSCYFVDENYILSAIAIMCIDEINEGLANLKIITKQKEKEKEYETIIKLQKLEEEIMSDETFAACRTEKDRLKYLRMILERACDYDIITYLDMELTSTGRVRAKGVKEKVFINNLWERLNR